MGCTLSLYMDFRRRWGRGEMGTLTSHITNIAQNKTRSSPSATANDSKATARPLGAGNTASMPNTQRKPGGSLTEGRGGNGHPGGHLWPLPWPPIQLPKADTRPSQLRSLQLYEFYLLGRTACYWSARASGSQHLDLNPRFVP